MYCVQMLNMVLEGLRENVIYRSVGPLTLIKPSNTPENFQIACEKLVEILSSKAASDNVPQTASSAQPASEACFSRVLRNQKTLQDFIGLCLTDKDDHLVLANIEDLSPPTLTEKKQLIAIRAIKRIESEVNKMVDQLSGYKKEMECSLFSKELILETDHVYVSAKDGKLVYTMILHDGLVVQDVATEIPEPTDFSEDKIPATKILKIVEKNKHAKPMEDSDLYAFSTRTLQETAGMSRYLRGEAADKEEATLDTVLKLSLDIVGEFEKLCKNIDSKNQIQPGHFFSLQSGAVLGEKPTPVQHILDILMRRIAKNHKRAFSVSSMGTIQFGIVRFSGETSNWYHKQNTFIAQKLQELYLILKDQIKPPATVPDQASPAFWAVLKNFLSVMRQEATQFDGYLITSPATKAVNEIHTALHQYWPKDFVIKLS